MRSQRTGRFSRFAANNRANSANGRRDSTPGPRARDQGPGRRLPGLYVNLTYTRQQLQQLGHQLAGQVQLMQLRETGHQLARVRGEYFGN